jgi:hypothetical protein
MNKREDVRVRIDAQESLKAALSAPHTRKPVVNERYSHARFLGDRTDSYASFTCAATDAHEYVAR